MGTYYDIIGVGVPYLDMVVQIGSMPSLNQSAPITGFQFAGGGKVPTALVAASRLGKSTALVAGLSNDYFGEMIRRDLEKEGITLQAAAESESSAISVVLSDEATRSRTILYSEGEVAHTDLFETDDAIDGRLLHISASGPVERNAIRWAKRKSLPIMLDADYYDPAFEEMAKDITLFIGSEHYFSSWAPEMELVDKLRRIQSAGPQIVIATLGEKGCMLLDRGKLHAIPAFAVEAVDTTGAGDVFHGAYAAAYLDDGDAYRSAVFASAVSAMKCRQPGGRAGIPSIEEVKRFLENDYRSHK
ncbi:carbohydrate kinase family protein [Paenibacillus nasutitermitis]|uniref:Ribokinase n=1 Tax=Paenibacillus nasutitermitis TaxID=1652958 RepID=A0A917DXU5_9BACL|nr:PfkB family carbohydrate kinase [Paenibacillus nasutitermitis]GGD77902.1 ribokinase [Paenibacillus nasutitermitis]